VSPRLRLLAALLPVLGLLGLVVRSELAQRGAQFRLAIRGYDPRDLIAGHYLRYQFELDWHGPSSCGGGNAQPEQPTAQRYLDPSCCLCLTRSADPTASPAVRQLSCSEARSCDGWLYTEQLQPPQRYYVPEDRALDLERALAERKAAVDVVTSPSGTAAVGELYLDGLPWRTALEKHAPPAP
jgi:hypothetical protein